jgi:hypothetical protein
LVTREERENRVGGLLRFQAFTGKEEKAKKYERWRGGERGRRSKDEEFEDDEPIEVQKRKGA